VTVGPEAPSVVVEAMPAQSTFQIGHPLWIDVRVENTGTVGVSGAVLRGFGERNLALFVHALGPNGRPCPDPFRYERSGFGANAFRSVTIPPGRSETLRIDLAKYVWLDEPGTYEIRFVAPLDHRPSTEPPPDDPLWVRTRVELVPPMDPESLAHAILDSADDWRARASHPKTWDLDTFEGLGHRLYVPILERFALEGGFTAADGTWVPMRQTSTQALAACPCTEATEALIRIYDADPDPTEAAAAELKRRIPGPTLPNDWFVGQVSRPDLTAAIAERARRALTTRTSDPRWADAYEWGGEILARVGVAEDGPLVLEALERAQAMPEGTTGKESAMMMLEWAAHVHPAPTTGVAEGTALLATVLQWDGRTGDPPAGWEDVVLRALASDDPQVVEAVMDRLPHDASPTVVAALVPHVGSPSKGVDVRLYRYLVHHPPPASLFVGPLRDALAEPPSHRTVGILKALRLYVPLDEWVDALLPELLGDPGNSDLAVLLLQALSGCRESGHRGATAAEAPTLVAAWQAVLRTHRATLREGPLPIVPGQTGAALVPASFQCKLESGELWPTR
jgi:hypothetical protein